MGGSLSKAPTAAPAPSDRCRHGGDPLHLRQHRPPKGVVLSHRNMVAGAKSVASYLENNPGNSFAALPLSFDAGFSQLTTAFHVGARVVLLNYLLPRDVVSTLVKERVTGLTAVPPLWIQLSQLKWPATVTEHLRYIANTGGRMPLETLTCSGRSCP